MLRKLAIIGLGIPLIAIIVALVYLFIFGESEPTFEDATQQLAQDHTVYALDQEGRRAALVAPFDTQPSEPLPLIIALHAYGSHVWEHSQYLGLISRINIDRFLLLMPNGTRDQGGNRFWNATEFCCDFEDSDVDDVDYIQTLLEEAAQRVAIGDIFLVGHSNGGFMSYRLACEHLPGLTAIVSLAGTSFADESRCDAAQPVSILHIHGDNDQVILYEGEDYPGALETLRRWAHRMSCDFDGVETLPNIDIDRRLVDEETSVFRYRQGCADRITIEHWWIVHGVHDPTFDPDDIGALILEWLMEYGRRS